MDNPDRSHAGAGKIIAILRKTTQAVRYVPFVYLLLYTLLSLTECFIPEKALCVFDTVLYASPVVTAGLLFFSRLLSMCKWHRLACLLPSSSQVTSFVDSHIFTFTQNEVMLINISIGIACVALLILIYRKVFVHA